MRLTAKQEQTYYRAYHDSLYCSVNDFYKSCSVHKQLAEKNIRDEMTAYNRRNDGDGCEYTAYGYRILGGNGFTFTAAYRLDIRNPDGIERSWLIVLTAHNRYCIQLYR